LTLVPSKSTKLNKRLTGSKSQE